MSLFGSLMADVEDDPFFGSHMRHMRQMNSFMMNSLFTDPFGLLGGGGPLAITGAAHGNPMNSMMPFMPQMPSLNGLFTAGLDGSHGHIVLGGGMGGGLGGGMGGVLGGASYTSSTVVMSSGPNGKPQVYSSTSSTKIGANGIKETRKTLQDTRTGTKKMSIGHHIGERAHLIEREQNVYTGDAEENQEFINLEEDEAEDFDREFQMKSGAGAGAGSRHLPAIGAPPRREPARPALPAPPACPPAPAAPLAHTPITSNTERRHSRPSSRRPIRASASPLPATRATVREVYSAPHPQRRHKHGHRTHRLNDN